MKRLLLAATFAATFLWVCAPAQFLGPPSVYARVAADTLSDSALTVIQIPPYGGSASVKVRSMTMTELSSKVNNSGGDADFNDINANSVNAITISCETCHFNDTTLDVTDSTKRIMGSGVVTKVVTDTLTVTGPTRGRGTARFGVVGTQGQFGFGGTTAGGFTGTVTNVNTAGYTGIGFNQDSMQSAAGSPAYIVRYNSAFSNAALRKAVEFASTGGFFFPVGSAFARQAVLDTNANFTAYNVTGDTGVFVNVRLGDGWALGTADGSMVFNFEGTPFVRFDGGGSVHAATGYCFGDDACFNLTDPGEVTLTGSLYADWLQAPFVQGTYGRFDTLTTPSGTIPLQVKVGMNVNGSVDANAVHVDTVGLGGGWKIGTADGALSFMLDSDEMARLNGSGALTAAVSVGAPTGIHDTVTSTGGVDNPVVVPVPLKVLSSATVGGLFVGTATPDSSHTIDTLVAGPTTNVVFCNSPNQCFINISGLETNGRTITLADNRNGGGTFLFRSASNIWWGYSLEMEASGGELSVACGSQLSGQPGYSSVTLVYVVDHWVVISGVLNGSTCES